MARAMRVFTTRFFAGKIEDQKITPLILIPFVENVFKYGISNHEKTTIVIQINVSPNKIHFFCQNKIFPNHTPVERTGIGIENTCKRLKLVYDGKQTLSINNDNGFFTVELCLNV